MDAAWILISCGCGVGQQLQLRLAWEPPYATGPTLKKAKKKKFYAFFKVQSGHHHLQGAFLALPFIGLGCHSSLHPRFFGIPLITALNGLFLFLDLLEC